MDACLTRETVLVDLPGLIERVLRGDFVSSPTVAGIVFDHLRGRANGGPGSADQPLTRRETEIVRLVAQGMSNKEIARMLSIQLQMRHIGEQEVSSPVTCVITRFGMRGVRHLLPTYRDYRRVVRDALFADNPGLLHQAFLLENPTTWFSLSLWSDRNAIPHFGTNTQEHVQAARRAFGRLRAVDNGTEPELWSTKWRLVSVTNNLTWQDFDLRAVPSAAGDYVMPADPGAASYAAHSVQLTLGMAFLLAAVPKVRRPVRFRRVVVTYQIAPRSWAWPVAVALIAIESFLALALLTGALATVAIPVCVAVLLAFGWATGLNLRRGRRIRCGCFGGKSDVISARSLVRLSLLLAGAVAASVPRCSSSRPPAQAASSPWRNSTLSRARWPGAY